MIRLKEQIPLLDEFQILPFLVIGIQITPDQDRRMQQKLLEFERLMDSLVRIDQTKKVEINGVTHERIFPLDVLKDLMDAIDEVFSNLNVAQRAIMWYEYSNQMNIYASVALAQNRQKEFLKSKGLDGLMDLRKKPNKPKNDPNLN